MTREFVTLPSFDVKWKDLGLDEDDKCRLEQELLDNPKIGPVMKGTGGVRKMRFAFRDRGKSGSTRVIYVDFEVYERIFFVDVYQKADKDNLTQAERNAMKDVVELIELSLEAEKQRRKNMSRYNEIMQGLHEALAYANDDPSVKVTVHKMSVSSVPAMFTPEEIKEIRLNANMTQSIFASCIGVTKKAVEAWEGGRSKPDGAARRTLGLFKQNPRYADDVGIIVR